MKKMEHMCGDGHGDGASGDCHGDGANGEGLGGE